jgi:hypothetical protein
MHAPVQRRGRPGAGGVGLGPVGVRCRQRVRVRRCRGSVRGLRRVGRPKRGRVGCRGRGRARRCVVSGLRRGQAVGIAEIGPEIGAADGTGWNWVDAFRHELSGVAAGISVRDLGRVRFQARGGGRAGGRPGLGGRRW